MSAFAGQILSESVPRSLEKAVLRTVAYADVFDYPLTADQIHRYLVGIEALPFKVNEALCSKWLFPRRLTHINGYYCLPGREAIVETRLGRAEIAARLWPKAIRYAMSIASLPFVRMVAITGALAMGNADLSADVDYLIVTAPCRVWLTRLLSIALVHRGRLENVEICPNYVISIDALDQFDRSFFSAHEIVQMVPLYGFDVYDRLLQSNYWVKTYLPNALAMNAAEQRAQVSGMRVSGVRQTLKRGAEHILKGGLGDFWERRESTRKIRQLSAEAACTRSAAAAFTPQKCKGHMADHGSRIQRAYTQRLERLDLDFRDPCVHPSDWVSCKQPAARRSGDS